MAFIFSLAVLLMITVPAFYICGLSYAFITNDATADSPTVAAKFFLNFASIRSDLFDLFNIIALPTISAYFGVRTGTRGIVVWIVFIYLLVLFVLSYLPEVAMESTNWKDILSTILTKGSDAANAAEPTEPDKSALAAGVVQYVKTVRNGLIAAIAVVAGIKLAQRRET